MNLARIFGEKSPITTNFAFIEYNPSGSFPANLRTWENELLRRRIEAYADGLERAAGVLLSARERTHAARL